MEYEAITEVQQPTTPATPFPRYQNFSETCEGVNGSVFIENFFNRFHNSFLYSFVLQFLLVSLMYANVGKGIYWKVLFYSSLAGLVAAIMESSGIAHACLPSQENVEKPFSVYFFLVDEIFWIISEYSIPYLNLIKMKAFASGKLNTIIRVFIIALSIPFIIFRFMIGFQRQKYAIITDDTIKEYHGYAFGVMAVADIICTFGILYFVKKNTGSNQNNLNDYIKHSSYTILITVDIVSLLLSIIDIITSFRDFKILASLAVPFHCLKSSFALILAIDAFLFKYGANVTSVNESSGANSKYAAYGNSSSNNVTYKSGNFNISTNNYNTSYNNYSSSKKNNTTTSYTIDMTTSNNGSPKKSTQSNIVSPYNFPTLDKETYNKSTRESSTPSYHQKSIIKNYTNIQTNSIFAESQNDPYELKVYSPKNFGFLNAQAQKGQF